MEGEMDEIEEVVGAVMVEPETDRSARFFVDAEGRFIGAFADGALPPEGAVEVPLPPPDGAAAWDGEAWTVNMSKWRESAYRERPAFVRSLVRNDVLPASEAVTAAKGDWPTTFASALGVLPVDPLDAQVDWAAASGVSRMNPLFLAVLGYYAVAHNLTAEQAADLGDRIFGRPSVEPVP